MKCNCGREYYRVLHRWHNHSAFNGYRQTPSDYSAVTCTKCGRVWRTKAGYVQELLDYREVDHAEVH